MSRILSVLTATLVVLVAATAPPHTSRVTPDNDEAKAIAAFKKAFRSTAKRPVKAEERAKALELLGDHDSAKVAKVLVDAFNQVEAEVLILGSERAELSEQIARLLKGQESQEKRTLPEPQMKVLKSLQADSRTQRERLDALRTLQIAIGERIARLASADAVTWLTKSVLLKKKAPLPTKLRAAEAVGAGASIAPHLETLTRALGKAKRPAEALPILVAFENAGAAAQPAAAWVVEKLEHDDEGVRIRACAALARMAAPEGIEPMIELLETEAEHVKKQVAGWLEVLTDEKHGTVVGSWRAWWTANRETILAGDAPLGGGMFRIVRPAKDMGYYFDIPQDGKSMIYIIDASGSMKEEFEVDDKKGGKKTVTRLAGCKAELVSALRLLRRDQQFNVIWYNDIATVWAEKMTPAKPVAVKQAQDWVNVLKPASSTNIHDALQLAFSMTGPGAKDRYNELAFDTIFLLTDGNPTRPDGQPDSTARIIEAVRAWNPLKRVTIHTIGIGPNVHQSFLSRLAKENNGEFKRY